MGVPPAGGGVLTDPGDWLVSDGDELALRVRLFELTGSRHLEVRQLEVNGRAFRIANRSWDGRQGAVEGRWHRLDTYWTDHGKYSRQLANGRSVTART